MIIIRADANEIIGTGHVMRCRSVATALNRAGKEVLFVIADHRTEKLLTGYDSICLESEWTDMEGEISKFLKVIEDYSPEICLIDSYYVTEKYLREISSAVTTAYFDDMNSNCWDVDYLINYNIFANALDYSKYTNTRTKMLLGPCYAPLREEFINPRKHSNKRVVSDILVSAGGADPERITERLIQSICPLWPEITFHLIVGALNPRLEAIKRNIKENVVLHVNENKMSDLMKRCDIAVSAAGTTLYELCAIGIPTITYTLADNQLIAADHFEQQGVMISAGDCRHNNSFIDHLAEDLRQLINDNDKRRDYSLKMQALVDGNGSERLVKQLCMR